MPAQDDPGRTEADWRTGADWRIEADAEWLATHRSETMAGLRRRFGRVLTFGDAVSSAELGPFGGAPRKPDLRVAPSRYSVVRYVVAVYAYTAIQVVLENCGRCGRPVQEAHHATLFGNDGVGRGLGTVRKCRSCAGDSWLFRSHMPAVARARTLAAKTVL